jgi:ApbE superfamily uncharacterized protein (UPF0280 family)
VHEPRDYRKTFSAGDLVAFRVVDAETDLEILAERDLGVRALALVREARGELESYIATHPRFVESYSPVPVLDDAPDIVRVMAAAGEAAGVGPMASVAGAIAERVARGLAAESPEVIVENGGDVYLMGAKARTVGLWSGKAAGGAVGLEVAAESLPLAVATSSGTFGHSLSFGAADSVTIVAKSGALADAVATAVGNIVRVPEDAAKGLERAKSVGDVLGAVVSVGGSMAAWGQVRLVPVGIE